MSSVFKPVIEELSEDNQRAAADLIRAGLEERWGHLDPKANPDLDDLMAAYGSGRTIVVRSDDGTPVGTGTLLPRPGSTAEVVRMSVTASARRLGVGRLIVDELLATACHWGVERVVLETTSTWEDAIEFYRRCGFVVTHQGADEFGPQTFLEYRLGPSPRWPAAPVRPHWPERTSPGEARRA